MVMTNNPVFTIFVVWHPSYREGQDIADSLSSYFVGNLYQNIEDDRPVSVLERSQIVPGITTPLPIGWNESEFTAVVVLTETTLVEDEEWVAYVHMIEKGTQDQGLSSRLFPVAMDRRGLELGVSQQALRWDEWVESIENPIQRLISDLTHEFCRMLRHKFDQHRYSDGVDSGLGHYLKKIKVFISHSKHDKDGKSLGGRIRDWIHNKSLLDSFFDVYDIPPGLSFEDVLLHEVGDSVFLAVNTDSYSSREWCRREVIEAKRRLVPIIVFDCVRDMVPRAMPYLGNVPVVRVDPDLKGLELTDRIKMVTSCLLDEVFRTWLWFCRVGPDVSDSPGVLFTPRPPELIELAAVPFSGGETVQTIVYPDPLLPVHEEQLFRKIAPEVSLQTLTDWLEGQP